MNDFEFVVFEGTNGLDYSTYDLYHTNESPLDYQYQPRLPCHPPLLFQWLVNVEFQ